MAEHPEPFDFPSWNDLDDLQLDPPDPAEIRRRGDRRRTVRRAVVGSVTAAVVLVAAGVAFGLSGMSTLPPHPNPPAR